MPDLLKRIAAPLVFAALALLAVATMVSDRRSLAEGGRDLPWWQAVMLEVAVPIQDLVASPADAGRRLWEDYVVLLEVREENQRLKDRVVDLEEENLQYREALVASEHLQQIAAMRHRFEVPMLPSEVVGLDVMPWFRAVLVDSGFSHGVRAGNPVITAEGVVGLVTATSQNAAKTMLLLDRQSAIDGIVQRSRARGVARGRGADQLAFEFVVRGGDVRVGDVVITSGLGGVFPKGLRIGEIVGISDSVGQLLQTATLQPAVDFGRLEQVFVMLRRGLTMDLLYGSTDTPGAGGTTAARRPPPNSRRAEIR
jgi:rod shape-determining protein MreC